MGTQVVDDDDITFAELGVNWLSTKRRKLSTSPAVDAPGGIDPVVPERGDVCQRFPMTKRDFGLQPVAA